MADTPTPPENPFDANLDVDAEISDAAAEQLPQGAPGVAAKAGKTYVVLGIVAFSVLFLLYNIFSGGKKEEVKSEPKAGKVAPKTEEPPPLPVAEPITPVEAPPIAAPVIPVPDPIEVPTKGDLNINPLTPKEDNAAKAQAVARMHSGLMVKDTQGEGGLSSTLGSASSAAPPASTDPNSQFASNLSKTKAERAEATSIGNLRHTIAQGRIIHATLETALNTDLPAPIRAIVSRDTFGEAGNTPLIPKGSRLIGQYNTTLTSGQTRVFVVWTRVIRPDGVDVALGSPLVDGIGQAGISGQVDTKFQEIFSRSLLSSVMNIAVAIGADELAGGTTTTTSTTTGSQTSGDAATTATTNALNRLGAVTDSFIQRFINVPPTILVDQGTPVNVFVNKDLVFPSDTSGTQVIY